MDNHHYNDIFIPGLELISLTEEYDDNIDNSSDDLGRDEPMIDWMEDCQVQENLFQIIPLTPEETRCGKDNHIIKADDMKVFFKELGFICNEPEPIDPGRDYEAEYKQQQQKYNETSSNSNMRRRRQRQRHVDLENMPTPQRNGTIDTVSPPGLSSTSSSFYHTDDDEDHHHIKSTTTSPHMNRLSYLNQHYQNHHHCHSHLPPSSSVTSKRTVAASHFSFTTVRF